MSELVKNTIVILVSFIILIGFSNLVSAECIGANYNFTCSQTINESCTLNESLTSPGATCFTIGADNLIIDGAGYNLTGDLTASSYGFYSDGTYSNITIKNITIDSFDYGMLFYGGSSHTITNNIIQNSVTYGLLLDNSADSGTYTRIENNTIRNNYNGIELYTSYFVNIANNNLSSNIYAAMGLYPIEQSNIHNNVMDNNTFGIYLTANNNNISYNAITNSLDKGIYLETSSNNSILNNNISASISDGISLSGSSDNSILGNNISANQIGMKLYGDSLSNTIYYNFFDSNTQGLDVSGYTTGIGIHKTYHVPDNNYFYDFEIPSASGYSALGKTNYFINSSHIANFTSTVGIIYWGWYVDIFVNDSAGNPIGNAKVFSYDYLNELFMLNYTNSSGFKTSNNYWEYKQVDDAITYISNYTIIATKNGLASNMSSINLSGNILNDNLTLTLELTSKKCVGTEYNFTCGDSINESCTLTGNITSLGTCFSFETNNLVLEGNNHTIFGAFSKGINLSTADNVTIQNLRVTNFTTGAYIISTATNSIIRGCEIYNNSQYGVYLDESTTETIFDNDIYNNPTSQINLNSADSNNISNNRLYGGARVIEIAYADNNIFYNNNINSSKYGIYASMTSNTNNLSYNDFYDLNHSLYWIYGTGNRIENNTFFNNIDLFNTNEPDVDTADPFAVIRGNTFKYNEITYIELPNTRELNFTKTFFNFSITLSNYSNSSYFTLNSLQIYPSAYITYTNTSNAINGYFIPTREGLYGLVLNVTDDQNNEITHTYYYSNSTKLQYYYRANSPTNGQPVGGVADVGTLLLDAPATAETRTCTNWIQFSFDNKSNSLEQGFKKITAMESYYRYTGTGNCQFGIEDKVTYGHWISDEKTIGLSADSSLYYQTNFYEKYIISNNSEQWLNLTMKMQCDAGPTLTLYTNQTDISYLNLSYIYTVNPIINSISDNTFLYSATSPPTEDSSIVQLNGEGEISLSLSMKNPRDYLVYLNGIKCPNVNCSYNISSNQTINLTLQINGIDNLSILTQTEIPVHRHHSEDETRSIMGTTNTTQNISKTETPSTITEQSTDTTENIPTSQENITQPIQQTSSNVSEKPISFWLIGIGAIAVISILSLVLFLIFSSSKKV